MTEIEAIEALVDFAKKCEGWVETSSGREFARGLPEDQITCAFRVKGTFGTIDPVAAAIRFFKNKES